MKLNQQAQQVIEYILIVAAVVAGAVGVSNPQGPMRNAVEKSLNKAISTIHDQYTWRTQDAGTCSVSCGNGTIAQSVWCESEDGSRVADVFCESNGLAKPAASRSCYAGSCNGSYAWVGSGFGTCSKTCGGGVQHQTVVCHDGAGQAVADSYCSGLGPKPEEQPCNTGSCYYWQPSMGLCNAVCGVGTAPVTSTCMDMSTGNPTAESNCDAGQKPAATTTCNTALTCGYQLRYNGWSGCSVSCGLGTKTQTASCIRLNDQVDVSNTAEASNCGEVDPSQLSMPCNLGLCYNWELTGGWSSCSTMCDDPASVPNGQHGVQTANVLCRDRQGNVVEDRNCDASLKPASSRDCVSQPLCGYSWGTDPWGNCDANCGTGNQTRRVFCTRTNDNTNVDITYCQAAGGIEPPATQQCTGDCYKWQTSVGACSTKCGSGTAAVTVSCVATATGTVQSDESRCLVDGSRPLDSQPCTDTSACHWSTPSDTGCVTSGNPPVCGTGTQTITYQCLGEGNGVVGTDLCLSNTPMPTPNGAITCNKMTGCCGNNAAEPGETCANCVQDADTCSPLTAGACGNGSNGCGQGERIQTQNCACTGTKTTCTADPTCNYQCTGGLSSGATVCSGSDANLISNLPWSYVSTGGCTGVKCQAQCPAGMQPIAGGCISRCGNGSCESGRAGTSNYGEDPNNCPSDCPALITGTGCGSCPWGVDSVSVSTVTWWYCRLQGYYGSTFYPPEEGSPGIWTKASDVISWYDMTGPQCAYKNNVMWWIEPMTWSLRWDPSQQPGCVIGYPVWYCTGP